jgi:methyl-accepting chemotaxis protein
MLDEETAMEKWTVGRRITVGFAGVILIAAGLGAFAYTRLMAISDLCDRIAYQTSPSVQMCDQLEINAKGSLQKVYQHVGSGDKQDKARLEEDVASTAVRNTKAYEDLGKLMTTGKGVELLEAVKVSRPIYQKERAEVLALSRTGTNNAEAFHLARTRLDPAASRYIGDIEALANYNRTEADYASRETQSAVQTSQLGILIGVGLALLVGGGLAFTIIGSTGKVLHRVGQTLDDGAGQVVSAAGQVSSSSQSLAEGASEQAASIQETGSSLEEMSSMTKRNAENSQKANDLAKQAHTAAEKGALDMRQMTAAMEGIKSSSDDIAKIIKTIDEIAFQTNILALNAAVEAARAGEAGMGFAVVAEEVRSLSQRCAQAAKETSAKIEGAIGKTAEGVEISGKVVKVLSEIVNRVREVDELVTEVAGATREQNQGIEQINKAVSQMDQVTQTNAANAEESAAAAEELNAQAESMNAAVAELLALVGGGARSQHGRFASAVRHTGISRGSATQARLPAKSRPQAQKASPAARGLRTSVSEPGPAVSSRRSEIPLEDDFKEF